MLKCYPLCQHYVRFLIVPIMLAYFAGLCIIGWAMHTIEQQNFGLFFSSLEAHKTDCQDQNSKFNCINFLMSLLESKPKVTIHIHKYLPSSMSIWCNAALANCFQDSTLSMADASDHASLNLRPVNKEVLIKYMHIKCICTHLKIFNIQKGTQSELLRSYNLRTFSKLCIFAEKPVAVVLVDDIHYTYSLHVTSASSRSWSSWWLWVVRRTMAIWMNKCNG